MFFIKLSVSVAATLFAFRSCAPTHSVGTVPAASEIRVNYGIDALDYTVTDPAEIRRLQKFVNDRLDGFQPVSADDPIGGHIYLKFVVAGGKEYTVYFGPTTLVNYGESSDAGEGGIRYGKHADADYYAICKLFFSASRIAECTKWIYPTMPSSASPI